MTRKMMLPAIAAGLMVTGCATNQYGYGYDDPYYSSAERDQRDRAVRGAVIGAAAGAVAGAVIDGVSVVEGAAVGAAGGAVIGAVVKGKQYYRDTRGYCYYVDKNGNPRYDYDVRC